MKVVEHVYMKRGCPRSRHIVLAIPVLSNISFNLHFGEKKLRPDWFNPCSRPQSLVLLPWVWSPPGSFSPTSSGKLIPEPRKDPVTCTVDTLGNQTPQAFSQFWVSNSSLCYTNSNRNRRARTSVLFQIATGNYTLLYFQTAALQVNTESYGSLKIRPRICIGSVRN